MEPAHLVLSHSVSLGTPTKPSALPCLPERSALYASGRDREIGEFSEVYGQNVP